jgi:large subunit ribosomal protein L9
MKIILRQDYGKLGHIGDVRDVKDGYARNFLIPRKIALPATASALLLLEEDKKALTKREEKDRKHSENLREELAKISVTVKMNVGEDDKLFGSVTSQMIADIVKEKGLTIDKRQIHLEEPIKALGIYDVPVKLQAGVEAIVKVWVVRE